MLGVGCRGMIYFMGTKNSVSTLETVLFIPKIANSYFEAFAGNSNPPFFHGQADGLRFGGDMKFLINISDVLAHSMWADEQFFSDGLIVKPVHQLPQENDWYEGVLELLRAGAKPNAGVKVSKITNLKIQNCNVSEIVDELTPLFFAINLNNIDVIKLLVIAGADTRGLNTVKFSHPCRAYSNKKNGIVYLHENATEDAKEVLKAGKKAPWAVNGLPAEGQRPL